MSFLALSRSIINLIKIKSYYIFERVVMLSISPFERIARKTGIKRISKDALEELRDCIDELGMEIAEKSVKISRHAGRRTVKLKDVRFVTKT
jgi:histone H3/H4